MGRPRLYASLDMDYYPPMSNLRTSITHPLQVAEVNAPGGGLVGITFCPGKCQPFVVTGAWQRDLGLDLQAIADWGAGVVVTLITAAELTELRVEGLGRETAALRMKWLHLPITVVSTPTPEWERAWRTMTSSAWRSTTPRWWMGKPSTSTPVERCSIVLRAARSTLS